MVPYLQSLYITKSHPLHSQEVLQVREARLPKPGTERGRLPRTCPSRRPEANGEAAHAESQCERSAGGAGWFVIFFVCLFVGLIGWLVGCLIGWLVG